MTVRFVQQAGFSSNAKVTTVTITTAATTVGNLLVVTTNAYNGPSQTPPTGGGTWTNPGGGTLYACVCTSAVTSLTVPVGVSAVYAAAFMEFSGLSPAPIDQSAQGVAGASSITPTRVGELIVVGILGGNSTGTALTVSSASITGAVGGSQTNGTVFSSAVAGGTKEAAISELIYYLVDGSVATVSASWAFTNNALGDPTGTLVSFIPTTTKPPILVSQAVNRASTY